jgi:hypothetical protein
VNDPIQGPVRDMRKTEKRLSRSGPWSSLHNAESVCATIRRGMPKALHMHHPHQSIPQMNLHF